VLTKLIDIGYQTGLFEASVEGAATSDELAARAGLDREWLGAMATWSRQAARTSFAVAVL
jgi:hypothetical protein